MEHDWIRDGAALLCGRCGKSGLCGDALMESGLDPAWVPALRPFSEDDEDCDAQLAAGVLSS